VIGEIKKNHTDLAFLSAKGSNHWWLYEARVIVVGWIRKLVRRWRLKVSAHSTGCDVLRAQSTLGEVAEVGLVVDRGMEGVAMVGVDSAF